MTRILPPPAAALRSKADVSLRFEDVTQDGRLVLEAIPNALGPAVWRGILGRDVPTRALLAQGIVPVLSRFVVEGAPGPLSANAAVVAEGACLLARASDDRIVLDMWADLYAPLGRTYDGLLPGVPGSATGEIAIVGRVFAEHVLTRPFAHAGERRVRDLDFPGAPVVRASREASAAPDALLALPEGATALEGAPSPDGLPITFGVVHTDSNEHVNSLVYFRLFEEAALRRLASLGRGSKVLGRTMEIAYRKPSFAGQTMRVVQQVFEAQGHLGTCAALVEDKDARTGEALSAVRPHAYARMRFE